MTPGRLALYGLLGLVGATVMARLYHFVRGDPEVPEATHPLWQTFLGSLLTLLALVAGAVAITEWAPEHADRGLALLLGFSCFLVNPRVWWVWELGAIEELKILLGDRLTMALYWILGLAIMIFGLDPTVGPQDP